MDSNKTIITDLCNEAYRIGGMKGNLYLCTKCNAIFPHSSQLTVSGKITCDICSESLNTIKIGNTEDECISEIEKIFKTSINNLLLDCDEDVAIIIKK